MKKPNERMEEARLSELMPGFDKEMEWSRLNSQLHPVATRKTATWKIAAAVLALIAAGIGTAIMTSDEQGADNNNAIVVSDTPANWAKDVLPEIPQANGSNQSDDIQRDRVIVAIAAAKKRIGKADTAHILQGLRRGGEFVCNSTPCPIEICITQKLQCKERIPSEVKSCSVLDPDQARQLRFNTPQAAGRNCTVSVSEISIERVATGEMIVLNDNSNPSTAQELFNCLTGDMECNMLAGIFKNDCDNRHRPDKLKIEKDAGSIILE